MNARIGIVDDHVIVTEGVKQILEFDGGFTVLFNVHSGIECLNMFDRMPSLPDIILLDINMPDFDGIEVLKEIRKRKIPVKVIMLTMHEDIERLERSLNIGVEGYLLKDISALQLVDAIKRVYNGEKYIQPELVASLNMVLVKRDKTTELFDTLTSREKEVLFEITKGKLNKEIADSLGISERTVKNHLSCIFKKLDVDDRTQAAVYVIKNNISFE